MKFWNITGSTIRFCLLSLSLTVAFACWSIFLMTKYRIHFWSTGSDYTELSLAHGIGTDLWLQGMQDGRGDFQFIHPGIPLQFVSWITYRASASKERGVLERAKQVLKNPEAFWRANRVTATLIMCASILLACAALKMTCRSDWALLAVPSFFLYQGSPAFYSYFALTNECFTLLLGTWVSFLAFQFFLYPKRLLWPVLLGMAGGLAYLNKLNYICWSLSIFPASLFLFAGKSISPKRLMLLWLLLGAGFLSALLLIGIPWLGLDSFLNMLKRHFLVFGHTGYYGTGSEGVVDANSFVQNAKNLWLTAAPFLCLSATVLTGSIVAALLDFPPCFQSRALSSPVPICWIVWLIVSIFLCTLAVLKHYQGHYFLVACPMILFLFGYLLSRSRIWLRLPFFAAVIFLIFPAVSSTGRIYAQIEKAAAADKAAFARVRALPIQDSQEKLWTYRVGAEEFGVPFVAGMANSPKLLSVAEALFPSDKVLQHDQWVVYGGPKGPLPLSKAPWRYAVISRNVAGSYPVSTGVQAHQPIPVSADLVATLFETDDVIVIEPKETR